MSKVGVTTECVADIPNFMVEWHHLHIIHFSIETDHGSFMDTDEITATNLFEYLQMGGVLHQSNPPSVCEYENFFLSILDEYDEIIHISMSSKLGSAYENALEAVEKMGEAGKKIHVFDSNQISSGLGLMALRASDRANHGVSCSAILAELEELVSHLHTSFVCENADFLYNNGKISKGIRDICNFFMFHPVLCVKEGRICLEYLYHGPFEKTRKRYVKKMAKKMKNSHCEYAFVSYAFIPNSDLEEIKEIVLKHCQMDRLLANEVSVTISSNCGPGAIGVFFL
ncbi:MAG: DegV family protein [Eubacteriales bacterium]|nr:DegV family protein [Eubacteriales bacterium]